MLARVRELGGDGALRCVVAWSGGLDSTVLLHLMLRARRIAGARLHLRAVHVDHALQPAAADFARACHRTARAWRVPLAVLKAHVCMAPGDSVEEAAREARYAALSGALAPSELLLTAQHADDQAETLLLALLRGAGPAGLAAMPAIMPLGRAQLLRPLLSLERAQLAAYATSQGLAWSDDPSNAALRFDRNYLRARVLPLLRARWPALSRTLTRSAGHCAAAARLVADSAIRDLELAADGADLSIAVLRRWSVSRRMAALRQWIASRGLRAPDARHLVQIERMIAARADAHPVLRLPELLLRRQEGRLQLEAGGVRREPQDAAVSRIWRWRQGPLVLPDGARLAIRADRHGDIDLGRLPASLCVMNTAVGGGRKLRKLLQELQVPEWRRARLPVLRTPDATGASGDLLAIADLWSSTTIQCVSTSTRRGRIFWRDAG